MSRVLDEVTTHLDAYSIRALARALRSWQGAILLITHDR
jgi:ATP-binding cassette subfamily F protein 3